MRIRFLFLYFICNSLAIAEEISKNYLLEHYKYRNYSFGIGFAKENQINKNLFGWAHWGNKRGNVYSQNLQVSYFLGEKQVSRRLPFLDFDYGFQNQKVQIIGINPGFNFSFLSFYINFTSKSLNPEGLSLGINVFPEKSIFFFYKKLVKEDKQIYALSILSGVNPSIGISLAKEYLPQSVEWSGSISLSFQWESYESGGLYSVNKSKEENTFFVSKVFLQEKKSLFENELNPFEQEINPENSIINKQKEIQEFRKKEKVIYEIKISELLKFRIPLVIAIKIARASKSKEEYILLLKSLPPDVVKKCNKIQFDKARVKP